MKTDEPIAFVTGVKQFDPKMADTVLKVGTPLYTHPADLTDEEIIEIWSGMETDTGEQNIAVARAILKKAQEK